ncbi:putative RNA-directed DNA polymerase [Lupinus albus]|uniref:Putative RNA-directed DNA polymerase n=1 Tax=Lupinus albus TaxID=3870 RepID=A0A6A4QLK8_LUPAL|nr:putative RNA-directed DNA polymerase [Lupinus albus]
MSQPLQQHWSAVKRILIYLQGSSSFGLHVKPAASSIPLSIMACCDADWASDPDDKKFVSGACVFIDPNIVTWWSKKQQTISKSSTEAEYRSLALATHEVIWIESLFSELKFECQTPLILCDNLNTVAMAHNLVLHNRTKHIELDLFFVRDRFQSKALQVKYIPFEHQTTDVLTKPLSASIFTLMRKCLRVIDGLSLIR